MAARGIGSCYGRLSPTHLNSHQKPSHSAQPHSRPCTPACRYTRFAFPSSVPGHNLPAAPHHSHPLSAVLQSPSNRSVLHEPSHRTASAIAARCIGHRTALRFPGQDTALCPSPHFLATASALGCGREASARPPRRPIEVTRGRGAQHGTPRPLEPGSPARAPRKTDSQSGMLYFPVGPQRSGATLYSYRRIT